MRARSGIAGGHDRLVGTLKEPELLVIRAVAVDRLERRLDRRCGGGAI